MTKPTDKYLGLRVYVVVPGTVQTPIKIVMNSGSARQIAGRFENTRDIIQSAGRQAMQIGHVRGMVEHHLILNDLDVVLRKNAEVLQRRINEEQRRGNKKMRLHLSDFREALPYHAITGIAKACRDSFELIHVRNLLDAAKIRYFEFHDTQEDEYENVVTALATEPVTPFAVAGILDYLPLWGVNS